MGRSLSLWALQENLHGHDGGSPSFEVAEGPEGTSFDFGSRVFKWNLAGGIGSRKLMVL